MRPFLFHSPCCGHSLRRVCYLQLWAEVPAPKRSTQEKVNTYTRGSEIKSQIKSRPPTCTNVPESARKGAADLHQFMLLSVQCKLQWRGRHLRERKQKSERTKNKRERERTAQSALDSDRLQPDRENSSSQSTSAREQEQAGEREREREKKERRMNGKLTCFFSSSALCSPSFCSSSSASSSSFCALFFFL